MSKYKQSAVVEKKMVPNSDGYSEGRVSYEGSSWPAICEDLVTLDCNSRVRVIGRDNITLIVTPVTSEIGSSR